MISKKSSSIITGLKFYTEEMTKLEGNVDTLFDEIYFLFLLNTRYKSVLKNTTTKENYWEIKERTEEVTLSLEKYFSNQKKKLAKKSIFEKSQFWFNFIGFSYLKTLEKSDYLVKLTQSDLKEIKSGFGYSATYDYMMTFFLQRLNHNVEYEKKSSSSKNEKVYIATHKFLLESDYFSRETVIEDNVEGLKKGTYYYDPLNHKLVLVNLENIGSVSNELSGYAAMLDNAAFTVILSANFWRNQWKYHERGYRVIHIDCGHVAQNLHMMATAYGLGSCCLMGFVDDELNELIKVNGVNEHSLYLITAGHKLDGRTD